jgi:hypothetical protein
MPKKETCELVRDAHEAVGKHVKPKSAIVDCPKMQVLDYKIKLGKNRILTPLEIPDFDELKSGSTKNKEGIDFTIHNRKNEPVDSVTLEVLDDSKVIYSEKNTSGLLDPGEHDWTWDGYSNSGVLDTKVLKSEKLKVRLVAEKNGTSQVVEMKLRNKAAEVEWIDAKIERNAKAALVTMRPEFTDGGVSKPLFGKPNPAITTKSFNDLLTLAKQGVEQYWSRNGRRGNGIGNNINTIKGAYTVSVIADLNGAPGTKADGFALVENIKEKFVRSRSDAGSKIVHNAGYWHAQPTGNADDDFKRTVGHEFGHRILNEYGGRSTYSWSHKGTSTGVIDIPPQSPLPNTPRPRTGEIDVMHYSSEKSLPSTYADYWGRSIAAEQDVKSLFWLSRVKFHE